MTFIEVSSIFYSFGIIFQSLTSLNSPFLLVIILFLTVSCCWLIKIGQRPIYLILITFLFLGALLSSSGGISSAINIDITKYISFITDPVRDVFMNVIKQTLDEPYSSLLGGIVFGAQASPLPLEMKESYRVAGVIHLLVVSGTQVSIILSMVASLCFLLPVSQAMKVLIATVFNVLFTVMVGAGPSIVRAAIMGEASLLAKLLGRVGDAGNALSLSAFLILLYDPHALFDIGFQLSFVATWSLFYIGPVIDEKLSTFLPRSLSTVFSMSLAPTLASSPIILYDFCQVSLVGIVSNILIVPWIESVVILGFASTLVGVVFLPLAGLINNGLFVMLFVVDKMVSVFSSLPYASLNLVRPNFVLIICYYIVLIGGIEMLKGKCSKYLTNAAKASTLLIIFSFVLSTFSFAGSDLKITFLDVGQGDSILIKSPTGNTMLIDGGPKLKKKNLVDILRDNGVATIDELVLTHPHDDHLSGLVDIIYRVKVKSVYDPGIPHTSYKYKKFLTLIDGKNIPFYIARSNMSIDLGGGAVAFILHPQASLAKGTGDDLNKNSVVIRVVYGDTSFMFTGDIDKMIEETLLEGKYVLKSDVLKVAHHGSKYSSSMDFIRAVSPKYAVIPVGANNKFGHPSAPVLMNLKKVGAAVYRTDISGNITVTSDGKNISVSTSK